MKAGTAQSKEFDNDAAFLRLQSKVSEADALGFGHLAAGEPNVEERLAALEKTDQVNRLLADLKARVSGK